LNPNRFRRVFVNVILNDLDQVEESIVIRSIYPISIENPGELKLLKVKVTSRGESLKSLKRRKKGRMEERELKEDKAMGNRRRDKLGRRVVIKVNLLRILDLQPVLRTVANSR
jgi:hypothetical protein